MKRWLVMIAVLSFAGLAQAQSDETGSGDTVLPIEHAPLAAAAETSRDDESIYVVQRRAYSKKGRFEITPEMFTSLNNKFVGHWGPSLSVAYHVRENFAVELTTTVPYLMGGFYSGLVYEVRQEDLEPEVVDLKQMRYFGAVSLQFSALYGKLNLFDNLVDYDFYVSAGGGLVSTVETCHTAQGSSGDPDCSEDVGIGYGLKTPVDGGDALKFSGAFGGGMRVFFTERLGLRLEVRDVVYADRAADSSKVTTDIRNNVIIFGGLSFLL